MTEERDLRSDILRAALETFQEQGFVGADMRTIAQRAAIAVGTIYNYFPNKGALFREVLRSAWRQVVHEMDATEQGPSLTWDAKVLGILDAQMAFVARFRALWHEMTAARDPGGPCLPDQAAEMRATLHAIVERIDRLLQNAHPGADPGERARAALALVTAAGALASQLPEEKEVNRGFLHRLILALPAVLRASGEPGPGQDAT